MDTEYGGHPSSFDFFGIPIPVLNTSTCNVKLNTKLGKLLNETKLIIWDEALMTHTYYIAISIFNCRNKLYIFIYQS